MEVCRIYCYRRIDRLLFAFTGNSWKSTTFGLTLELMFDTLNSKLEDMSLEIEEVECMQAGVIKGLGYFAASVMLLTGCGSKTADEMNMAAGNYSTASPQNAGSTMSAESGTYDLTKSEGTYEMQGTLVDASAKLIKTMNLAVETKNFDQSLNQLNQKVASLGGYVEDSSVNTGGYGKSDTLRYAYLTVRIPADQLDNFTDNMEGIGIIISKGENVRDVTLDYVDVEAHITSLQTEMDKLNELMASAENVEDIIAVESQITQVRYQLESYQSQQKVYDQQIDYSTVTISLNEVMMETVADGGLWQDITSGFKNSLYHVGKFFRGFFVGVMIIIPYVIAIIAIIWILTAIRRYKKKRRLQKLKETDKNEENT